MGVSYGEGIKSIQSFWEDAYISGWLDECVLVITYSDIVSKDKNEAVLAMSKFMGIEQNLLREVRDRFYVEIVMNYKVSCVD